MADLVNRTDKADGDSLFAWAQKAQLAHARKIHPAPLASAHEAWAVIAEELEEFWEEVRKKKEARDPAKMRIELLHVAAMAQRTAEDLGLVG